LQTRQAIQFFSANIMFFVLNYTLISIYTDNKIINDNENLF